MDTRRKKIGIIPEVAILFAIGLLATTVITYFSQHAMSSAMVREQMESFADHIADEVIAAVEEYPAYPWLLSYWREHDDELDIEYDVNYVTGLQTKEKCLEFAELYPDLDLRYISRQAFISLPEEGKKLYAEIVYSWLITRINEIKSAYNIDFVFCVLANSDYTTQYFLFSAADPDSVRGSEYLEVYPLGVTVSVADNEEQQEAMRLARQDMAHLALAGDYVDYYAYMCKVDGDPALIGLTYNLTSVQQSIKDQTKRGATLAALSYLALALICLGLISRFVLRPLKKVQQSIRLYKNTKDSAAVVASTELIRSSNELGELSRDVAGLAVEMDDYLHRIESITAEKERIGAELSLASRIQEDMLPNIFPPFPERADFDIYASMTPAKEVGGDFYDYFFIDDDHLALVIADVSGKGVPAALFMMVSMILIHQTTMNSESPARALERVNELICTHNKQEMFVSVWLGILDLTTGKLTAANAGHEYPALKRPDGSFEIIKAKHGFIVGGMEGVSYKDYELQLEPGSKLFLYTDGVPEATGADNELFGMERMVRTLQNAEEGEPADILAAMNRAVDDFVGDEPQFDDLTMVCLHYKGIQPENE